jgi:hypothetical protein
MEGGLKEEKEMLKVELLSFSHPQPATWKVPDDEQGDAQWSNKVVTPLPGV